MNAADLIQAVTNARARLDAALAGLSTDRLSQPGASGDWSVKDVLAHVTAWEVELLTKLGKAQRGQKTDLGQWTAVTIEAQNAKWYAEYAARPLDRVLADYHGVHRQLLRVLEPMADKDLNAPAAWLRGKTLAQVVMDWVVDHELEHAPGLEAWRKAQLSQGG